VGGIKGLQIYQVEKKIPLFVHLCLLKEDVEKKNYEGNMQLRRHQECCGFSFVFVPDAEGNCWKPLSCQHKKQCKGKKEKSLRLPDQANQTKKNMMTKRGKKVEVNRWSQRAGSTLGVTVRPKLATSKKASKKFLKVNW